MVAYHAGDLDRSAGLHQRALELGEQLGDRRLAAAALIGERRSVAEILVELAEVESAAGNARRAATLFGASEAIREDIGAPIPQPELARFNDAVTDAVLALGAFTAAHGAGRELSVGQAVAFARDGSWAPAQPDAQGGTGEH